MKKRFETCLFLLCTALPIAGYANTQSELPEYTIQRSAEPIAVNGRMDESSWLAAKAVREFLFPWWEKGDKEPTEARLLWDDQNLYVCFVAHDRHISAVLTKRDDPVSNDDCVEVFVAPDPENPKKYFNFEINALGTLLDRSPHVKRSADWNAEAIQIAITCDGTLNDESDLDRLWTTEIAIPLAVFKGVARNVPPADGDIWRLNLYRIGGQVNPQYSLWSNTQTEKPSYHVPERFGIVRFSVKPVKEPNE
ncbi:MAG: carbohydrate-binding family 9-like protein [bacterium]